MPHISLINGNTAENITSRKAPHTGEITMKFIVATAALALSLSAPAFADTSSAQAIFALTNDSPAENHVGATSSGNPVGSAQTFALTNDSVAENTVSFFRARNVDVRAVQQQFALGNDSAAERIVK